MENKYLTVTALNRYLKAKLESDIHLNRIYITGELSNVKYHYSGHCYFTLKDETSRINAVMFATQLKKVLFKLEDGMKVIAICRLSVYEPQGTYQLYVEKIDVDGVGNLYMAYEKRRLLLEKEGLFSNSHKKSIPHYPQNIGIITASTGAAIHDIVRTIKLNCPSAKITLYPSLVQGENAASMLTRRVIEADNNQHDVLIIGRGGGSLEDLWAFNDENLARAIYHARTPIISGVGHESDVTICDFVADLRAATPTAAASAACFNQADLQILLNTYELQITNLCLRHLKIRKDILNDYKNHYVFKQPERYYQNAVLKNVDLSNRLLLTMAHQLQLKKHQHQLVISKLFNKADLFIITENKKNQTYKERINQALTLALKDKKQRLISIITELNAYNPLNVLERGFTLTKQNGIVLTRKQQINPKLPITIQFMDGKIETYMKEDESNE